MIALLKLKFIYQTADPQVVDWLNGLTDREKSFLWYAQLRSLDYKIGWTPERMLLAYAVAQRFCNPCPSQYECCASCPMMRPCIPQVKPQYCRLYFCPHVFWQLTKAQRIILYGENWNAILEQDFFGRSNFG